MKKDQFSERFFALTGSWDWKIEGFLDTNNYVHPIDADTKVISTVFERLSSPVIRTIANDFGYRVEVANQTTYPDFTITKYDSNNAVLHRIAVDIKTTYLAKSMMLTLGGYNSFIRNNTKNILYPYSTYQEHWVLGFVYRRLGSFKEYDLSAMPKPGEIACPFSVESIFIRDKHLITGLRAGSGNTKNIGSVKVSDPHQFSTVMGPFSRLKSPKESCDKYWANYERYSQEIYTEHDLSVHKDFM